MELICKGEIVMRKRTMPAVNKKTNTIPRLRKKTNQFLSFENAMDICSRHENFDEIMLLFRLRQNEPDYIWKDNDVHMEYWLGGTSDERIEVCVQSKNISYRDPEGNVRIIFKGNGTVSDETENNSTIRAFIRPDLSLLKKPERNMDFSFVKNFSISCLYSFLINSNSKLKNVIFSPVALYNGMSMACECENSKTKNMLLKLLSANSEENLRKENESIIGALYFNNSDEGNCFELSNSIWMDRSVINNIKSDVLKTEARSYKAHSFVTDFSNKNYHEDMEKWLCLQTGSGINVNRELKNDSALIINSPCFKNSWITPFEHVINKTFDKADGSRVRCDFLVKNFRNQSVGTGQAGKMFSLPMSNGYRMTFVLPYDTFDVDYLVLHEDYLSELFNQELTYEKCSVNFSVPKFSISSLFSLKEMSGSLGISGIFSEKNTLDSLSESELHLEDIYSEASLKIDENGCGGKHSDNYEFTPMLTDHTVSFHLNKPFFFYISTNLGIPVYTGIVNDPTL